MSPDRGNMCVWSNCVPPSHQNLQDTDGTQCFVPLSRNRSIWSLHNSAHPSLPLKAALLKILSAPSFFSVFEIFLHRPAIYQKIRASSESLKHIKMFRATLLRSARLTSSSARLTRQIRVRAMPTPKFYALRTPILVGGVRTFSVTNPQRSTIEERVKKIVAEQLGVKEEEVRFPGSFYLDT